MYQPDYTFDPEHRHDHAAMLEAEVERRGLQGRYVSRLMSVVDRDTNEAYLFDYITATPAQRTEAAVLTIEAVERKES